MMTSRCGGDAAGAMALSCVFFMLTCPYAAASPRHSEVLDATVCEISANPQRYDHKIVRVRGTVVSDGLEHTNIADSACPSAGIGLQFSHSGAKTAGARRLRHEIVYSQRPDLLAISVTLRGTFWLSEDQVRWISTDKISLVSVVMPR